MSIFTNYLPTLGQLIESAILPFALDQLKGFPIEQYNKQIDLYNLLQYWYDGKALEVVVTDKNTGNVVEKYPIKINPIKGTCAKHAARVIGQNTDSIRFGGLPFQIIPEPDKDNEAQVKTVKDALLKVLTDNGFGSAFLSTTIRSQYLAGAVVAVKWLPLEKAIEVSTPSPKEFIGIPKGANLNRLREAWIVREISLQDAEALGYKRRSRDDKWWYIEHWTEKEYKIQVNDQVIPDSAGAPQQGENPWGVVPMVYVPHIRIDGFLGTTLITETVKGVIKEINLRWADIGDAVSDDSHDYVAIRNVTSISTTNIGDDRPIVDLGSSTGLGTGAEPHMFAVGTKSTSEPMLKFVKDLYAIYRREVNHPAVADGEDEGSQRSSLTLAVRMAPLVDEAEFERLFWTVGLTELARIMLTIMADKQLHGITKEMIEMAMLVKWQPMLPRDREAFSTEAAVRSKNKITANQTLNEMFGDVLDPEEDQKRIEEETKALTAAQPQQGFGNRPAGGSPTPSNGK